MITLSPKELKKFEEFIYSPFFNKNELPVRLFNVLKVYHPKMEESKVAMEAIFPKVFPKEKIEEQRLRYVMRDLTKLLEEFLTYTEYEKEDEFKKYMLLSAYDNRNLEKYFKITLDQAKESQDAQPYRDVNYLFNRYLIDEKGYEHSQAKEPNTLGTSIQSAVENLDKYYLSNKLRYCCFLLSRQSILHEEYPQALFDEIVAWLGTHTYDDTPSISIYYQILRTLLDRDNAEEYQKLRELLAKNTGVFQLTELHDMYNALLNFCIRKINGGDSAYLHEIFDTYRTMVENGVIFDNGYIAPNEFKNVVMAGLRSDETAWVEKFLEEYKDKITPEYRQNTYIYNLAILHYYKKEFSKSLKLMQTAEFKDVFFHLDAKALLLRTYYELNEAEPFFSLVDAFNNYLKRNKLISEYQRTIYINLVKYARKLMLMKQSGKIATAELRIEIEQVKQVANLQWLMQKIEEMESAK